MSYRASCRIALRAAAAALAATARGDTPGRELRLITCGGELKHGHRPGELIVYPASWREPRPRLTC
ncbi:hypothetical protein LRD69_20215 [Streptomyces sp. JH14]|uniref:hypothetical protein n=1 Tax=Streptomyces sp. JH14 TaxID=2793630 RepID=UPI0023F6BC9D|nr:hypothetical protein [Streptomyces sp. JH14]MDF6044420.1 hypothetical protein [Streptomyces sp. JH14]